MCCSGTKLEQFFLWTINVRNTEEMSFRFVGHVVGTLVK